MGHVYTQGDARALEKMMRKPKNRKLMAYEHWLMTQMLRPVPGQTGLDIGCGAGHGLVTLREAGLVVTGLDPSPHMIRIAEKIIGKRADLHRGVAEELPFDDNEFTYACLNRTLEFVENPLLALEEAFRVAKDRVFIGVTNKYSTEAARLRLTRLLIPPLHNDPYRDARFFSIWELKRMIRGLVADAPIHWQTYYILPYLLRKTTGISRPLRFQDPTGQYLGVIVELVPRFRTRLLHIKDCPSRMPGAVTGLARTKWSQYEGSVSIQQIGQEVGRKAG